MGNETEPVDKKYWYAIYTKPRFEKKVAQDFEKKKLEGLLPLRSVKKVWSDRVKKVEEPLFPSYIFVHANAKERYLALQSLGVVRMVSFGGEPVRIPEDQIDAVLKIVELGYNPQPHQYFRVGDAVEVVSGPLSGIRGNYFEERGKGRLAIAVDLIQQALSIEVEEGQVRRLDEDTK